MSRRKNTIRGVVVALLFLLAIGAVVGYQKYRDFLMPNVPFGLDDPYVCIPTNSDFPTVARLLDSLGAVKDTVSFRKVAEKLKYKKEVMRAGRFKIEGGWNNLQLVRYLRSGEQAPVTVVLNMARLTEEVAAKASRFIEPDSAALATIFNDQNYLSKIGYSPETLMSLFIPNSYQFFWNTTPEQFMERMVKEHDAFWSKNNRSAKADSLGLNKVQVYTLASIVERETNQNEEKARIAGVYLNRLKINMLLQADPTSVFATRDFAATRVLDYHKNFDSPYNTYRYAGLPPGPISMASIPSLDAVLNPEQHDYLYFCAKPDASGFHSFAKTLAQHNVNAQLYRESLKNRN
jgi:UPF0755 protein